MKTLGFEQVKMSQSVLGELYNILKGDKSALNKYEDNSKHVKDAYKKLEKLEELLENMQVLNMDESDREELEMKCEMFREQLEKITRGHHIEFQQRNHMEYDKLQTWTNALRFSSLFFNDGKVNLLTKEALQRAVDGKFNLITTNKGDTINEVIQQDFPVFGLSVGVLKDIASVLRNQAMGKGSDKKKMETVEPYIQFDEKTGTYVSTIPEVRYELGENNELRCVFPRDLGVDVVVTLNNVDRKEALKDGNLQDVLANKYSISYETKPLKYVKVVKPAMHKFIDGKKVVVPPVYANIDSDELFNLFRNANAHASRQDFNPSTKVFTYRDEDTKSTLVYDFGWLQGFSSFFLNEGQCMLYGEKSQYNALPGWKKDWTRKKFLNPNNEFPIIINKLPDDKFNNFNDFKKYLNDRQYVLVTINDNIQMVKVEEALDNIRADFYTGQKTYKRYLIDSWLRKYKIKDYEVKEVQPQNKDKMVKYWEKRLASIPGFYDLELHEQYDIISEIESVNKYDLDLLTSSPNVKFNYAIMSRYMNMINRSIDKEYNPNRMGLSNRFEISKDTLSNLEVLNQEYAVLFASMMVYTSLIQSGFADIICEIDGDKKKYNTINIKDHKALEELNLSKFNLSMAKKDSCININPKKYNVDDKKDVLRIMRHAVAHGRVAVKDAQEFYENPDDIKLVFHAYPKAEDKDIHSTVETTVGAIMETFKDPMFRTPTNTEIKGTALTKY